MSVPLQTRILSVQDAFTGANVFPQRHPVAESFYTTNSHLLGGDCWFTSPERVQTQN